MSWPQLRPAWEIEFEGYTPLSSPIVLGAIRHHDDTIRRVKQDLVAAHGGSLYFPFEAGGKRPRRAIQGYLAKFPAALLDAFDDLAEVPRGKDLLPRGKSPQAPPGRRPGPGAGYISDPVVRRTVEYRAVDLATEHYTKLGYQVQDVGSTESWDLECTSHGETRLVEVKGGTRPANTVDLTVNEFTNAQSDTTTDLYVWSASSRSTDTTTAPSRPTAASSGCSRTGHPPTKTWPRPATATAYPPAEPPRPFLLLQSDPARSSSGGPRTRKRDEAVDGTWWSPLELVAPGSIVVEIHHLGHTPTHGFPVAHDRASRCPTRRQPGADSEKCGRAEDGQEGTLVDAPGRQRCLRRTAQPEHQVP